MREYYSITELTREFDISTRTLRFYEDEGLIQPVRRGRTRLFRPSDRHLVRQILRGKRLGFSINEIREIIQMYKEPPGEVGQLKLMIKRIEEKREDLRQKRRDLEETLAEKIARAHGKAPLQMGGVREAAEIINNAARSIEKRVMPAIGKIDKQLARELENEMFKFEHLYELDKQMMGQLLREIENEALIDALKGIEEEQREYFFAAMSSRAADGLRDEIEARGRIKRADVEAAQKQIVAVAKRLAADGTIVIGGGGDEEYV